jgi:predicted RNase H-like HicB family nuclease
MTLGPLLMPVVGKSKSFDCPQIIIFWFFENPRHPPYAVGIEKADHNYAAYVPDLPGCIATGLSIEETEQQIREAITFHLLGLHEDGQPIPEPTCKVYYVIVAA